MDKESLEQIKNQLRTLVDIYAAVQNDIVDIKTRLKEPYQSDIRDDIIKIQQSIVILVGYLQRKEKKKCRTITKKKKKTILKKRSKRSTRGARR